MRILLRVVRPKSFQALQSYLKMVGENQLAVTNVIRAAQNVKASNHVTPEKWPLRRAAHKEAVFRTVYLTRGTMKSYGPAR
jgi:alkyl hydroperoxide reductase subunit AhpC